MHKNTILFVDDEIHILNSLKRGLIDEPYACLFAQSGQEALKLMEKYDVHVIVTDMRMPGMNGLELLKIIKEKYPNTIKVVLSGYTQLPQILATINQVDIFKFITKPWKLEEEFKKVLHDSIEYYNLKDESIKLKQELKTKNNLYQTILKDTDDKFNSINSNIKVVNEISNILFSNMSEQLDKNNYRLKFSIEMSKKVMPSLINSINSTKEQYDLRRILGDVKKILVDDKIKINVDNFINKKYYGNYKILQSAFKALFDSLNTCIKDDILINIYESDFQIKINIILSNELHYSRFEVICNLFNKIFEIIKSNVFIDIIIKQ